MAVILPLLKDRVRLPVHVLFVGINPGIRSATIGHHFAGYSNRFWKLLYESGLLPAPIGAEDDERLPDWGYGITNLVPRPTPGIDTLTREEYAAGLLVLRRKVRRWKPGLVALVGATLYRAISDRRLPTPTPIGLQEERFEGAQLFVLPNPSGRNANFSYAEMLAAFRALRAAVPDSGGGARTEKRPVGESPPGSRSGPSDDEALHVQDARAQRPGPGGSRMSRRTTAKSRPKRPERGRD